MTLQLKTSYTKNGKIYNRKTPEMKVIGKEMDIGESHTFTLMSDKGIETHQPKTQFNPGNYVKDTMFVKDEATHQNITLELSSQACGAIRALKLTKGDTFHVAKGTKTDAKTGALMPIVVCSRVEGSNVVNGKSNVVGTQPSTNHPLPSTGDTRNFSDIQKEFVTGYVLNVTPALRSKSHFIGSFMRQYFAEDVSEISELYDKTFPSEAK